MNFAALIKITILGTEPAVWRKVTVNSNLSLAALSEVIQTIMPWEGYHKHKFICGEQYFMPDYEDLEAGQKAFVEAYNTTKVGDLLFEQGAKLQYVYDFNDCWEHRIVVEKIGAELQDTSARYMKGRCMAPPDDCGGTKGFEELKAIMEDPQHADHKDMREWLSMDIDEEFDPLYVGLEPEDMNDLLFEAMYAFEESAKRDN